MIWMLALVFASPLCAQSRSLIPGHGKSPGLTAGRVLALPALSSARAWTHQAPNLIRRHWAPASVPRVSGRSLLPSRSGALRPARAAAGLPSGTSELRSSASFIREASRPGATAGASFGAGLAFYDLGGLRAHETAAPELPEGGGALGGSSSEDGLSRLHPRVLFLQDVLDKPASPKTVEYLERLLDKGVHVVFLTWRPAKGEHSAEEVLLKALKARRANPVVVASFNGGKIALHGRAREPRAVLPDVEGLPPQALEAFRSINARLASRFRGRARLSESTIPASESPFLYTVELGPRSQISRERLLGEYNRALEKTGLPYRMAAHPENPRALMTQSMPLRFSLQRVFQALDHQFQGEELLTQADSFLILTDSKRSPRFSGSFPKGASIHVVKDAANIEEALGSVLGDTKLPVVSLKLGKLRQYVEYWEPAHRPRTGEASEGGSRLGGPKDRETGQKMAMLTGSLINTLIPDFIEKVWRGQHKLTTLNQLLGRLKRSWYRPAQNGVRISKPMARMMRTQLWKALSRGYLEYASSYVSNFYLREFGDYSSAARDVQDNLVSLGTDRKSLISLEFISPFTGKLYRIHTRIPRVMKLDTAEGRVLTAYAHRTGKETPDDGEEIYAKVLAMALLRGHARRGPDGKWHHGAPDGPALARLVVQLEYRSSHRSWVFKPEEFFTLQENGLSAQGRIVQEITSTIEKMEADEDYQEHYRKEEEQAKPKDLKKKPSKRKPSGRKTSGRRKG